MSTAECWNLIIKHKKNIYIRQNFGNDRQYSEQLPVVANQPVHQYTHTSQFRIHIQN